MALVGLILAGGAPVALAGDAAPRAITGPRLWLIVPASLLAADESAASFIAQTAAGSHCWR